MTFISNVFPGSVQGITDIRINVVNFVFICRFETLWIMDLTSGEIKECIEGLKLILYLFPLAAS